MIAGTSLRALGNIGPASRRPALLVANRADAATSQQQSSRVGCRQRHRLGAVICAATSPEKPSEEPSTSGMDAKEAVEKYGLEAGLFKVFTEKPAAGSDGQPSVSRTDQAKQLLTQYGSAYLATSITLAIISFSICYAAVSSGVDIGDLLSKIGIQVTKTNETVGTFAIAYAAHKALSPVRFPPTVALTPVVAKWFGKKG